MLTAIRNIYSIVTDFNEHRLGREESFYMEPRKVDMSDQFCRGCHLPHTLDEDKKCEFCRRGPVHPRVSVFTRIWKAIVARLGTHAENMADRRIKGRKRKQETIDMVKAAIRPDLNAVENKVDK